MMKFTGTLSLGLGIILGVPALTFGGGIPGSLKEALNDTIRAIDVLNQVEQKIEIGAPLPAGVITRLTEPAILDARGRDALLNTLREEVGTLQAKVDRHALNNPTTVLPTTGDNSSMPGIYGPGIPISTGAGPTPVVGTSGNLNLAGITTGMSSNMRTAISMGTGNVGSTPADGVAGPGATNSPISEVPISESTAGADSTTEAAPNVEVTTTSKTNSPEGEGYSANPLRQAQACFRAKRYQQGLDLLVGAPKSPEVTYWKARLEEKLGNWSHAITLYTEVKDDAKAGDFADQAEAQLEFVIWQREFEKKTKGDNK